MGQLAHGVFFWISSMSQNHLRDTYLHYLSSKTSVAVLGEGGGGPGTLCPPSPHSSDIFSLSSVEHKFFTW